MNLCVESRSASYSYIADSLAKIVDRLRKDGYEPLIRKATENFCSAFGASAEELFNAKSDGEDEHDDLDLEREIARRRLLNLEKLGYTWNVDGAPKSGQKLSNIIGELFFTDDRGGLVFITILEYLSKGAGTDSAEGACKVRVGYLGQEESRSRFRVFAEYVHKAYSQLGVDLQWVVDDLQNAEFQSVLATEGGTRYQHPPEILDIEIRAAKILETQQVREVGMVVRQAGVLLAKELLKQKGDSAQDVIRHVDSLLQADLLHQEYVVICSKTGAHVNRVESRDTIDRMAQMGVLCSCGQPISAEPIEGLLAADPLLLRMIDKNYWMVATVIRQLHELRIPTDKILLESTDGGDQLEFMVDIDGTLVMFEFKDGEFGLSQAINLGGRIGLHRPKLMFLVSTKGISPEVRDHFKRMKPEAQLVYVPNASQLESTLTKVVEGIRMMRARSWMSFLQSLLNVPFATLLLPVLGKEPALEPGQSALSLPPELTAPIPVSAAALDEEIMPAAPDFHDDSHGFSLDSDDDLSVPLPKVRSRSEDSSSRGVTTARSESAPLAESSPVALMQDTSAPQMAHDVTSIQLMDELARLETAPDVVSPTLQDIDILSAIQHQQLTESAPESELSDDAFDIPAMPEQSAREIEGIPTIHIEDEQSPLATR